MTTESTQSTGDPRSGRDRWQQRYDAALAKGLVAGLPGNGFAPRVATYSREEWKALQRELVIK